MSFLPNKRPKRSTKPPQNENSLIGMSEKEERDFKLAVKNSSLPNITMRHGTCMLPEAPSFYPTVEEFADPFAYLKSIENKASCFGICKIIPPKEINWCSGFVRPTCDFPTRLQKLGDLQEAKGFDDGPTFNWDSFKKYADDFRDNHFRDNECPNIEREYWRLVETSQPVSVLYASDLPTAVVGSGFSTKNVWNLCTLPTSFRGILKYLDTAISGVTQPWLYIGMLFSSFCWHCEDENLPSVSFLHHGAAKTWYGIPSSEADLLESVLCDILPNVMKSEPDFIFQLVAVVSPAVLAGKKVNVYRLDQNEGEFVVTWPRGFHSGFNQGFNCAEAVNLGWETWFPYGRLAMKRYKTVSRESTFSHDHLLLSIIAYRECKEFDTVLLLREIDSLEKEDSLSKVDGAKYKIALQYLPENERKNPSCIPQCSFCNCYLYLHYFKCMNPICPGFFHFYCLTHWNKPHEDCDCGFPLWFLYYRFSSSDWSALKLFVENPLSNTDNSFDPNLICPKFKKQSAFFPFAKSSKMSKMESKMSKMN